MATSVQLVRYGQIAKNAPTTQASQRTLRAHGADNTLHVRRLAKVPRSVEFFTSRGDLGRTLATGPMLQFLGRLEAIKKGLSASGVISAPRIVYFLFERAAEKCSRL